MPDDKWFAQKRKKGYRRAEECATGLYGQISHIAARPSPDRLRLAPEIRGVEMQCMGKHKTLREGVNGSTQKDAYAYAYSFTAPAP